MNLLKQFILAFAIIWLQVFALSACMMDQATAYSIITGEVIK